MSLLFERKIQKFSSRKKQNRKKKKKKKRQKHSSSRCNLAQIKKIIKKIPFFKLKIYFKKQNKIKILGAYIAFASLYHAHPMIPIHNNFLAPFLTVDVLNTITIKGQF